MKVNNLSKSGVKNMKSMWCCALWKFNANSLLNTFHPLSCATIEAISGIKGNCERHAYGVASGATAVVDFGFFPVWVEVNGYAMNDVFKCKEKDWHTLLHSYFEKYRENERVQAREGDIQERETKKMNSNRAKTGEWEKEREIRSQHDHCVLCLPVILKMAMIHLQFRRAVFHLSFPSKSHHFENRLLFVRVSICVQTNTRNHFYFDTILGWFRRWRLEDGFFVIFVEYKLCLAMAELAFCCDCDLGTNVYDPRLIPDSLYARNPIL